MLKTNLSRIYAEMDYKKKNVLRLALLTGCGIVLFLIWRIPPVLLNREIEVVQDYDELAGKWLANTWVDQEVLGEYLEKDYIVTFEPKEITGDYPLKEQISASICFQINHDLSWEDLLLPGIDIYPSHIMVIAVLRGRILHETATYQWLGGFQYTKERYFVDSLNVTAYGLYISRSSGGDKVWVANNDVTKCTAIENWPELLKVIASPAVGDLIE